MEIIEKWYPIYRPGGRGRGSSKRMTVFNVCNCPPEKAFNILHMGLRERSQLLTSNSMKQGYNNIRVSQYPCFPVPQYPSTPVSLYPSIPIPQLIINQLKMVKSYRCKWDTECFKQYKTKTFKLVSDNIKQQFRTLRLHQSRSHSMPCSI